MVSSYFLSPFMHNYFLWPDNSPIEKKGEYLSLLCRWWNWGTKRFITCLINGKKMARKPGYLTPPIQCFFQCTKGSEWQIFMGFGWVSYSLKNKHASLGPLFRHPQTPWVIHECLTRVESLHNTQRLSTLIQGGETIGLELQGGAEALAKTEFSRKNPQHYFALVTWMSHSNW